MTVEVTIRQDSGAGSSVQRLVQTSSYGGETSESIVRAGTGTLVAALVGLGYAEEDILPIIAGAL